MKQASVHNIKILGFSESRQSYNAKSKMQVGSSQLPVAGY
jgi:hypothetical protein